MTSGPVAVIPARGGSKGIPEKNLRKLGGVPLVSRTIGTARLAQRIEQVYVTSDSEEILAVAKECGAVPIARPRELSGGMSPSELALLHALSSIRKRGANPQILVFLQCTSPFTQPEDVDRLVAALDNPKYRSALTVISDHSFLWRLDAHNQAVGINHDPRRQRQMRQQLPPQYRETGAGYAVRVEPFEKGRNRFCPPIALVATNHPQIEIDDFSDLQIAELLLQKRDTRSIL
jgi:N-acylneuraminate cytidylyltransferase